MNIMIGTDIVDNRRFEKLIYISINKEDKIYNHQFLKRIFTENEIDLSYSKKNVVEYFASRFAAKEAILKAIGTGIGKGINYYDIEILNYQSGKPYFLFYNKILEIVKDKIVELSISHEKNYSIAFVIVYDKE